LAVVPSAVLLRPPVDESLSDPVDEGG